MNSTSARIGDLCVLTRGTSATLKTLPGQYPLVVTAAFRRTSTDYQLEGPAVCVPLISSTGHGDAALHRVHYQDGKFALANLLVALKPKDPTVCDAKYLYHLLSVKKDKLFVPLMLGTANVSLKERDIAGVQITLPPVEEQRRIVARVDAIASRATEARRLREECTRLLTSAFRAALTRLFADYIPSGTLADVLSTPPRNGWSARCDGLDSGTPILALSAVTGYRYRSAEIKRTSEPTSATADYWLRPGDVLITRSNTPALVGHAAIYDGTPAPCIYPDLMMRLDLNKQRIEPRFLIYWLQTSTVRDFIDKHAKGTSPTMKKISQGTVQRIPFPSQLGLSDQERIVAHLDALQGKLEAVRAEQRATAAELDALLPSVLNRAFAGQL